MDNNGRKSKTQKTKSHLKNAWLAKYVALEQMGHTSKHGSHLKITSHLEKIGPT